MTLKPPRASVSIKLVGECWASKGVIGRARCERQEAGATGASLRLAGTPIFAHERVSSDITPALFSQIFTLAPLGHCKLLFRQNFKKSQISGLFSSENVGILDQVQNSRQCQELFMEVHGNISAIYQDRMKIYLLKIYRQYIGTGGTHSVLARQVNF